MDTLDIYTMSPDKLVRALLDMGWSQEEIALYVDSNQSTISRVLRGQHQNPRYQLVQNLRELIINCNELSNLTNH